MRGVRYSLVVALVVLRVLGLGCKPSGPRFPMEVEIRVRGTEGCRFYGEYRDRQAIIRVDDVVPTTYTVRLDNAKDYVSVSFYKEPEGVPGRHWSAETLVVDIVAQDTLRATDATATQIGYISIRWSPVEAQGEDVGY